MLLRLREQHGWSPLEVLRLLSTIKTYRNHHATEQDAIASMASRRHAARPSPGLSFKPIVGEIEAVQHIGFGVSYGHVPGFERVQWYVESRRPTGTPGAATRAADISPVPMPCRVRPCC